MERSRDLWTGASQRGRLASILLAVGGLLALPALADEPLAERRTRIEAMSPAEKEELARREKRFARLNPAEQKRLHQLNRQLEGDRHSYQLREVMHRYYQWVTTLPPYERSALLEMPPSERLDRVREMLGEQARKAKRPHPGPVTSGDRISRWLLDVGGFGSATATHPTAEDLKSLQSWLEQYLERHRSTIVDRLPEPQRSKIRERLDSTKDPGREKILLATAWLQRQLEHSPSAPAVSEKELAALHERLSPELKKRLAGLSPPEQRRVAVLWMRLVAFYRVLEHPEPLYPLIAEEELARFFEEKLDPPQRDRLLSLPVEDTQRELLLAYLRWRLAEQRPRQPQRSPAKREPGSLPQPASRGHAPKGSGN